MNQYPWLDSYLLGKPGAEKGFKEEWQWWRYLVGGKQFAATCQPGPEHRDHAGREMVILKCDPRMAEIFRETYTAVVPGFYSDKRNWNTVYLDGDVPDDVLRDMCDQSYTLVFAKLKKAEREAIKEADSHE